MDFQEEDNRYLLTLKRSRMIIIQEYRATNWQKHLGYAGQQLPAS
jgi:hypothetical protein